MDLLTQLRGKTIAITGSSGYIGSAILASLAESSIKILGVSRSEQAPSCGITPLRADVNTYECWEAIVSQAEVIFHLAGNTSIHQASKFPVKSLKSTLLPLEYLSKAAQKIGRKPRVVFASTATVFGLTDKLPVAEAVEAKPITVYDLNKLFAEQQLAMASRLGIIDGVSLRLANVFGPSSSSTSSEERGILNKIVAMAMRHEDIVLYGNGSYLRDYVFISDVVHAFLCAGTKQGLSGKTFNVATGIGTPLKKAFEMVVERTEQATGRRVSIDFRPWPIDSNPIERRSFVASIENFTSATEWRPVVDLKTGINLLVTNHDKFHSI
jgi:nucleoside-diphosphate-sugar epimerase